MSMLLSLWLPILITTVVLFFAVLFSAKVMQVLGATANLAHTAGGIIRKIRFTRPLRAKLMDVIDAVAYGLIAGLVFAWMWPN